MHPFEPPPQKTQGNRRFSGAFRGYQLGTLARNGLRKLDLLDRPSQNNMLEFVKDIDCKHGS